MSRIATDRRRDAAAPVPTAGAADGVPTALQPGAPTAGGAAAAPDQVAAPVRPAGPTPHGLSVVPVKHWGRWIVSVVVAFLIVQFLWSLAANPKWQWDVFAEYFFAPSVLESLVLTLQLTAISGVIGFALGAVLAIFRLSKSPLLNAAAWWYIWFFRSVPLVVQILVWYNLGYLYPTLGLGTPFTTDFWLVEFPTTTLLSAFAAATIGLSLHQAAYSAEIIRAGILSVDQGQLEAAAALALPRRIRFFRITLPQAARAIVPNAFNEIIGLVKGTSVVFIVALPELFYTVQVIYNRNQRVIPMLLVAVVWYAVITTVLSIAQYYVERRFARGAVRELPPTPIQRARRWAAEQWRRLGDQAPDAASPPSPTSDAPTASTAAATTAVSATTAADRTGGAA
ncbi:amino acid ABC transporter permease [Agromyces sp. NPDC057865]|uniref:amino acid ABC transporter permease n=1 Tax=Agromyces sp. NPDC057865 TaxID=3346267 RepID=UPI00366BB819